MGGWSHDTSQENIDAASMELVNILGPHGLTSDIHVCRAHSSTPWSPASTSESPALVAFPNQTSDVSEIMRVCSRRRVPVIAFSGGTSFPGALAATRGGICIDFQKMDQIIAVHKEDMDVVVQPAVDWQDLNAELATRGLFFPPDPGPGAGIGGMIAMNCSGPNAYRHGTMKAWVISMTVVLADGTVVKSRKRPRKSSAGYDLTSLVVGSEGTLGLVTEAVLKVTALPENQHVAVAAFPTTRAAVDTAVALITSGLLIDALELLDPYGLAAINKSGMADRQWKEAPTLFLRFSGAEQVVKDLIRRTQQAAKANGCETFEASGEQGEVDGIWGARKAVRSAFNAMKKHPSDVILSSDAAVPISRLAGMIDWTNEIIDQAGLIGSTVGHVGDGNYHAAIICSEAEEETARKIIGDIQRKATELEGTITGEHGVGLELRDMLVLEAGDSGIAMMRTIKTALDPNWILNPDKIFRLE
ncbi:MAG: hypothetical protein Q9174_004241 [Haloplaca sp. 1 TL-2023]